MFHHCMSNTGVFTSLLGPEQDHLWLKHYITRVHSCVQNMGYIFSVFHQVTPVS